MKDIAATWGEARTQLTAREVSDFEFVRYLLAIARIPEEDLADVTARILRVREQRPTKRLGDRRRSGATLRSGARHRPAGRGVGPRYAVYGNFDGDTEFTVPPPDSEK